MTPCSALVKDISFRVEDQPLKQSSMLVAGLMPGRLAVIAELEALDMDRATGLFLLAK